MARSTNRSTHAITILRLDPLHLSSLAFLVILVLAVGLTWSASESHLRAQAATEVSLAMQKDIQQASHLSELLHMILEISLATRNPNLEARYRALLPVLATATVAVVENAPTPAIGTAAMSMARGFRHQAALQVRIYALLNMGEPAAALELLRSQEYADARAAHSLALASTTGVVGRYAAAAMDRETSVSLASIAGILAILFLSFVSWLNGSQAHARAERKIAHLERAVTTQAEELAIMNCNTLTRAGDPAAPEEGRASPGRASPGRASPGRASPGRASLGRTTSTKRGRPQLTIISSR